MRLSNDYTGHILITVSFFILQVTAISCNQSNSSSTPKLNLAKSCYSAEMSKEYSCKIELSEMEVGPNSVSIKPLNGCGWMSFNSELSIISGQPSSTDYGSCSVLVTAGDDFSELFEIAVFRRINGLLDSNLDGKGYRTKSIPSSDLSPQTFVVDSTKAVIVAIQEKSGPTNFTYRLERYTGESFNLDLNFSNASTISSSIGSSILLAIDAVDNIYFLINFYNGTSYSKRLYKFKGHSGVIDTTFATQGYLEFSNSFSVNKILTGDSNNVFLIGNSGAIGVIEKYSQSGTPIQTFGVNGRVTITTTAGLSGSVNFWTGILYNDHIIVAGDSNIEQLNNTEFSSIWKIQKEDGNLSAEFGFNNSGSLYVNSTRYDSERFESLQVDRSGEIYALSMGYSASMNREYILRKFSSLGTEDPAFSMNLGVYSGGGVYIYGNVLNEFAKTIHFFQKHGPPSELSGTKTFCNSLVQNEFCPTNNVWVDADPATSGNQGELVALGFDGFGRLLGLGFVTLSGETNRSSLIISIK